MTTLPRVATAPELALLRSDGQSTRLFLTIHQPATVYTARLAAVPSSTDKVAEITYNSGSGTLANVLADMTLYVGSSAGAFDYGMCRVRKDGTTLAGTFYIAEESEINWISNAYLTVVDEFDLWPRHIRINPADGTTPFMDYDVAYTNQNQAVGAQPTPIMGPDAVLWLRGATVSYSPDAASSWVKGGTIASYAWTATGASASSGMTTATPTITYNATGTYRIDLTVTGDNAVSFTGHRSVFVVNESSGVTTQFEIASSPSVDYGSGGWSFSVTLFDEATLALVRDRALVILHAIDYYGTTQQSIGYVTGSENIVAIGRIAGESITWGTEDKYGTVTFDVQGPQYWFGRMTGFPNGVKDVSDVTTPNKWTKFRGLTLNDAWYHAMAWCSTATRCMDVYPNTDTRRNKRLEAPGGENLWAQLVEICKRSILADPICDRYGRAFVQIEHQLVSDRSSFPTVQTITTADWIDEIRLDRVEVPPVGLIDMSGISWDGTTATPIFSLSPGHVFKHHGAVEVVDRLALLDQSSTNTQCGLYSAWKNNRYPRIDIKFASNHRLIDLAPYQRLALAITASDTPRGLIESLNLIPRSLTLNFDNNIGVMLTSGTFEAEVTADLAVTGDTPSSPPATPPGPIAPPTEPPPVDPGLPSDAKEIWMLVNGGTNGIQILWSGDFFNNPPGSQPSWNAVAVPTGYTIPPLALSFNNAMQVCLDGSSLYVSGRDSGNSNRDTIWQLTNIAAIRANPATAPVWSSILYVGQVLGIGTVTFNQTGSSTIIHVDGSNLYSITTIATSGTRYYSIYNGTAWTFTSMGTTDGGYESAHKNAVLRQGNTGSNNNFVRVPNGANYGSTWQCSFGATQQDFWGRYNSTDNYWTVYTKTNGSQPAYFRYVNGSAEYNSTENTSTGVGMFILGGAYGGSYCYIESTVTGNFWITSSGAGFALFETFTTGSGGRTLDAKLAGGGKLVRTQAVTTVGNAAVFINISRTAGAWSTMSGDIDTVYPRVASLNIYSTGLVF